MIYLRRMPFDWRTEFGYLIAIIVDCNGVFCSAVCYIPIYSIFVGSCLTFALLIDDITNEVPNLKMDLSLNENHPKFRALFCNTVRRVADARQLSDSATIYAKFWVLHVENCLLSGRSMIFLKSMNFSSLQTFCGLCRIFAAASWPCKSN